MQEPEDPKDAGGFADSPGNEMKLRMCRIATE